MYCLDAKKISSFEIHREKIDSKTSNQGPWTLGLTATLLYVKGHSLPVANDVFHSLQEGMPVHVLVKKVWKGTTVVRYISSDRAAELLASDASVKFIDYYGDTQRQRNQQIEQKAQNAAQRKEMIEGWFDENGELKPEMKEAIEKLKRKSKELPPEKKSE